MKANASKMMGVLFLTVNLGICIILCIFSLVGFNPQVQLSGVTIVNEKPSLSISSIMDGSFQTKYDSWYSVNFPVRSILVKGYNQIKYIFRGQISSVIPGKGDDLHGDLWLDGYINTKISDEIMQQYTNDLLTIKDEMEKKDKIFMYLISPNKPEIYPETMPWNYRLAVKYAKDTPSVKNQVLSVLRETEIPYYDSNLTMQNLKENGITQPYSKTGIHWNSYGGGEALRGYFYMLNSLGANIPEVFTEYTIDQFPEEEDVDYKSLINVYQSKRDTEYPHVSIKYGRGDDSKQVFAITTSFHNFFMRKFKAEGMPFLSYKRFYYNQLQTILIRNSQGGVDGELFIPPANFDDYDYSEIFLYDIFVIEHSAGELPQAHIEFIHKLAEHIRKNG